MTAQSTSGASQTGGIVRYSNADEAVASLGSEYVQTLWDNCQRMRDALLKLQQWDMLTLTEDGKGAVTSDAPWARKLIAEALGNEQSGR